MHCCPWAQGEPFLLYMTHCTEHTPLSSSSPEQFLSFQGNSNPAFSHYPNRTGMISSPLSPSPAPCCFGVFIFLSSALHHMANAQWCLTPSQQNVLLCQLQPTLLTEGLCFSLAASPKDFQKPFCVWLFVKLNHLFLLSCLRKG